LHTTTGKNMTANEHFDRIFTSIELQTDMHRIMFVAGYESALNEIMNRSQGGTFSAYNLALDMYSESVREDLKKIRDKNAEATNNETENSI
jgi:hypothetical protein